MIIDSSNVIMGSSRKNNSTYLKKTEETTSRKGSKISTTKYSEDVLTISDEAREFLSQGQKKASYFKTNKSMENNNSQFVSRDTLKENEKDTDFEEDSTASALKKTYSLQSAVSKIENKENLKLRTLLELLQALFRNKSKNFLKNVFSDDLSEISDKSKSLESGKSIREINSSSVGQDAISRASNRNIWTVQKRESSFVKEEEVTNFSSTGFVKTSDGRSISFNVNLEMSRSFEQYVEKNTSEEVVLIDPLVINLTSAPANISDQTFFFDIDADGEKDEISTLGKGSGFLALDKNGDGVINDGRELFGALTGNGFSELAQYDDDGNGWIDEADDIFSKLKVWTKDDDGNDILLSLKDADLGAIYLGKASTEFSVNNSETNEQKAQIKSTGVYLKESGGAGTIQQVDFAVKK